MRIPRIKDDENKIPLMVYVAPKVLDRIKEISGKLGITKSALGERLMIMGLDDAELLDGLGFTLAVQVGKQMLEAFKKSSEQGQVVRS